VRTAFLRQSKKWEEKNEEETKVMNGSRIGRTICSFMAFLVIGAVATKSQAALYDIKIKLASAVTLESLQFDVDYTAAGGEFVGIGGAVSCVVNPITNAAGAFNDDDSVKKLTAGLIQITGIVGKVKIVTCTFDASSAPAKTDFVFSNLSWSPDVGLTPKVKVSFVAAQ